MNWMSCRRHPFRTDRHTRSGELTHFDWEFSPSPSSIHWIFTSILCEFCCCCCCRCWCPLLYESTYSQISESIINTNCSSNNKIENKARENLCTKCIMTFAFNFHVRNGKVIWWRSTCDGHDLFYAIQPHLFTFGIFNITSKALNEASDLYLHKYLHNCTVSRLPIPNLYIQISPSSCSCHCR